MVISNEDEKKQVEEVPQNKIPITYNLFFTYLRFYKLV